MKILLLSLACLAAVTCQAQSIAFAAFSGEYLGIATPVHWYCVDRVVVDAFVYPDGSISLNVFDYDFDPGIGGTGTIDARGKFIVILANGHVIYGTVAKSGTIRGSFYSDTCRATFTALRRYKLPYAP